MGGWEGLVECSVHFGFSVRRDTADGERAKGATAAPLARSPSAEVLSLCNLNKSATFR